MKIALQMGHCYRKSGSTGTYREQEFTSALGHQLAEILGIAGHEVALLLADPPGRQYPECDLFAAIHCDGSSSPSARGASLFYPTWRGNPFDSDKARHYATAWHHYHGIHAGYTGGARDNNYVPSVGESFYAWRADRVLSGTGVRPETSVAVLWEHYFATNGTDDHWAWVMNSIPAMAEAHALAIGDVFGHPQEPSEGKMGQMVFAENPDTGAMTPQWFTVDGIMRRKLTSEERQWYRLAGWLEEDPVKIGYDLLQSIPTEKQLAGDGGGGGGDVTLSSSDNDDGSVEIRAVNA